MNPFPDLISLSTCFVSFVSGLAVASVPSSAARAGSNITNSAIELSHESLCRINGTLSPQKAESSPFCITIYLFLGSVTMTFTLSFAASVVCPGTLVLVVGFEWGDRLKGTLIVRAGERARWRQGALADGGECREAGKSQLGNVLRKAEAARLLGRYRGRQVLRSARLLERQAPRLVAKSSLVLCPRGRG